MKLRTYKNKTFTDLYGILYYLNVSVIVLMQHQLTNFLSTYFIASKNFHTLEYTITSIKSISGGFIAKYSE